MLGEAVPMTRNLMIDSVQSMTILRDVSRRTGDDVAPPSRMRKLPGEQRCAKAAGDIARLYVRPGARIICPTDSFCSIRRSCVSSKTS